MVMKRPDRHHSDANTAFYPTKHVRSLALIRPAVVVLEVEDNTRAGWSSKPLVAIFLDYHPGLFNRSGIFFTVTGVVAE